MKAIREARGSVAFQEAAFGGCHVYSSILEPLWRE